MNETIFLIIASFGAAILLTSISFRISNWRRNAKIENLKKKFVTPFLEACREGKFGQAAIYRKNLITAAKTQGLELPPNMIDKSLKERQTVMEQRHKRFSANLCPTSKKLGVPLSEPREPHLMTFDEPINEPPTAETETEAPSNGLVRITNWIDETLKEEHPLPTPMEPKAMNSYLPQGSYDQPVEANALFSADDIATAFDGIELQETEDGLKPRSKSSHQNLDTSSIIYAPPIPVESGLVGIKWAQEESSFCTLFSVTQPQRV